MLVYQRVNIPTHGAYFFTFTSADVKLSHSRRGTIACGQSFLQLSSGQEKHRGYGGAVVQ